MAASNSAQEENVALSLSLAVVEASQCPLLLLEGDLRVLGASHSFCREFGVAPAEAEGVSILELGHGEWNVPQLRSLLTGIASGDAEIEAYEFDLKTSKRPVRRLSVNARLLHYLKPQDARILVAVADVTDALADEKAKAKLEHENSLLLKEVRHRVANSLQIIASVLLQGARKAQSREARGHLRDAHNRVMSIASLERQLAPMTSDEVEIRAYLTRLCGSIADSMISDRTHVVLEVSADDRLVPASRAISLGLITTELVINALKHAFPDGRGGKVAIQYQERGPAWALKVQDDGVGMSNGLVATTAGLGTSIVEALARQLDADVRVGGESGLRISVTHEDPEGRAARPVAAAL